MLRTRMMFAMVVTALGWMSFPAESQALTPVPALPKPLPGPIVYPPVVKPLPSPTPLPAVQTGIGVGIQIGVGYPNGGIGLTLCTHYYVQYRACFHEPWMTYTVTHSRHRAHHLADDLAQLGYQVRILAR